MRALININIIKNGVESYPTNKEFRQLFEKMGLRHTRLPIEMEEDNVDSENMINDFFKEKSKSIIERIPQHNEEQQAKINEEVDTIIYFSHISKSKTDFMITRQTDGELKIRLLNSRIEHLHNGCEEIVSLIQKYNHEAKLKKRSQINPILNIDKKIEIYEHGLEDPTIYGDVISNKFNYIWRNDSRDIVMSFSAIILFLLMVLSSPYFADNIQIFNFIGRLETAMITTFIISSLSIFHIYYQLVPVIQWSLKY